MESFFLVGISGYFLSRFLQTLSVIRSNIHHVQIEKLLLPAKISEINTSFLLRIMVLVLTTLRERDEKESTGVGLAIIKKIIEEQHGMIRVISKVGEGAEFIFTWRKNRKL